MPIYEYRCRKCGKDFELLVRSARDAVSCPDCGGKQVERQLSVFAAAVKGAAACPSVGECPSASSSCCRGGACTHRH